MPAQHLTDKNLALDLVRVTEAGALASARRGRRFGDAYCLPIRAYSWHRRHR